MKGKLIVKITYILILCLSLSMVAMTASSGVYEGYYEGIFETLDLIYYRDLGLDNIAGTALNGTMANLNEYSGFVLNDSDGPVRSNAGIFLEKVRNGLRVVSVLPDSSAADSGISAGDTIILMDKMSTAVMSEDAFNFYIISNGTALVSYIEGDTGLTKTAVLKPDTNAGREVEVVYLDKTVYIRVNRFSDFTTSRIEGVAEVMKELGNSRIILDFRSLYTMNIEEACEMAELFVPGGAIARTGERTYNASHKEVGFEIAILVDEKTTGAAEAVAMAIPGTVYGHESAGYAVFTKQYPVLSQSAYKYYAEMTGKSDLQQIFNYLKSRKIEIKDEDITGYLNIVESGIYAMNRRIINENNSVIPDTYVKNTTMGYLRYTPGSYVIDIEREYSSGSVNYDVYVAKKILGFLGYFDGEYNVVFNDDMVKAVNAYKKAMGFAEDGILDMNTQSSLNTYSMRTAVSDDDCVGEALAGFEN